MQHPTTYLAIFAVILCVATLPLHARAAGFEKTNLVSARYTGVASAVASSAAGAESISLNPAGLAQPGGALEASVDFALGLAKESAPIVSSGVISSTPTTPIPIGGAYIFYGLTEKLGVGAGLFVSGGAGADYGNIDFGANFPALQPEFNSILGLIEASFGAAYELIDGLRVGAAWRIIHMRSESKAARLLDANTLFSAQLTGLSGTAFNGFRLGVQCSPREARWGIGATVRTAVDISATGESSGALAISGSPTPLPAVGGDATLSTRFPFQAALGGHFDVSTNLRLMSEYSFTHNTAIQGLTFRGAPLVVSGGPSIAIENLTAATHWRNQHQLRLGTQWQASERWALRGGYIYGSQVVPNDFASPFFTPPGAEHVLTAGAGVIVQNETRLDFALEYIWVNGEATGANVINGSYAYSVFAGYAGVSWKI